MEDEKLGEDEEGSFLKKVLTKTFTSIWDIIVIVGALVAFVLGPTYGLRWPWNILTVVFIALAVLIYQAIAIGSEVQSHTRIELSRSSDERDKLATRFELLQAKVKDYDTLTERASSLEGKNYELAKKAEELQGWVTKLSQEKDTLINDNASLKAENSRLKVDTGKLTGRISQLEDDIRRLRNEVHAAQTALVLEKANTTRKKPVLDVSFDRLTPLIGQHTQRVTLANRGEGVAKQVFVTVTPYYHGMAYPPKQPAYYPAVEVGASMLIWTNQINNTNPPAEQVDVNVEYMDAWETPASPIGISGHP